MSDIKEKLNIASKEESKVSLEELIAMCEMLQELREEKKKLENELDMQCKKVSHLENKLLPEAFEELGLNSLDLKDGTRIHIQEFKVGRITPETEARAFKWLKENGHDGIIKDTVNAQFNRGQNVLAEKIEEELRALGISFSRKQAIHPQTLKSFINEKSDEEGFPTEDFNIHEVKLVKVIEPK